MATRLVLPATAALSRYGSRRTSRTQTASQPAASARAPSAAAWAGHDAPGGDRLVAEQCRHRADQAGRLPGRGQPGRDLEEHGVADLVAETVIDHLEVVEVEKQERAGLPERAKHMLKVLHERGTDRQAGELIVTGAEECVRRGAVELGDVVRVIRLVDRADVLVDRNEVIDQI